MVHFGPLAVAIAVAAGSCCTSSLAESVILTSAGARVLRSRQREWRWLAATDEYQAELQAALEEAWLAYGTDRASWGHGYASAYAWLVARGLKRAPRRLLEIGVGHERGPRLHTPARAGGAGLRSWRDIFPEVDLVGYDVHPRTMLIGEARIRTYLCDTTAPDKRVGEHSAEFECPTWGPASWFDIIVDDASHHIASQLMTFSYLRYFLQPDGFHVIEDVLSEHRHVFEPLVTSGIAVWSSSNEPGAFNGFLDDSNIVLIAGYAARTEQVNQWLQWAESSVLAAA